MGLHTIVVNLRRSDNTYPWGISLVGGSDVGAPLIITKVGNGTAADGQLYRGDIITKIGDYDARDVRHEDAEALFRNAGNQIKIVVQRRGPPPAPSARQPVPGSLTSSPFSPLSLSPNPSSGIGAGLGSPSTPYQSPGGTYRPYGNLPHTIFPAIDGNEVVIRAISDIKAYNAANSIGENDLERLEKQPYRTTPLVLPGAKAKRDTPNESYLRHHPNPVMRQAPHILDHEVIMKQRVADSVLHKIVGEDATVGGRQIVHKQFNSPINLYSENNIADTIQHQTGVQAPVLKKPGVFDPSRSETLRALQEEEVLGQIPALSEPVAAVVPKVFQRPAPQNRIISGKKPLPSNPPPQPQSNPYVNSLGESGDTIHQSGSFKRLMYNVLGQTDY